MREPSVVILRQLRQPRDIHSESFPCGLLLGSRVVVPYPWCRRHQISGKRRSTILISHLISSFWGTYSASLSENFPECFFCLFSAALLSDEKSAFTSLLLFPPCVSEQLAEADRRARVVSAVPGHNTRDSECVLAQ